jgi:16S rRNA (uracil1498-N3)-methyltransferase
MKQFILTEEPDKDGYVRLRDDDFHYLVTVRRLRPGGLIKVLRAASGGAGGTAAALTILSIDNNTLVGRISPWEADMSGPAAASGSGIPPIPPIILFQALPKGSKMDLIVRQAAEGALAEVVPFVSEHSLPRGKSGAAEDRWRRIIKEARQQSGSAVDTQIHSVLTFEEALAYWETLQGGSSALGLLLHEQHIAPAPLEQGTFHGYLYGDPQLVAVAAGPEGGFSAAELERFLDAGFKPLCMGETVLRSETAALYGAAAVRIILLENASWMLKN